MFLNRFINVTNRDLTGLQALSLKLNFKIQHCLIAPIKLFACIEEGNYCYIITLTP